MVKKSDKTAMMSAARQRNGVVKKNKKIEIMTGWKRRLMSERPPHSDLTQPFR
jgi:hypothetical protein